MSIPYGLAGLFLLFSLVFAPTPKATKSEWIGQTIFVKSAGTRTFIKDKDNNWKQGGQLRSIEYRVTKEEDTKVQLFDSSGADIWVEKEQVVLLKDAVAFFTQKLQDEPNDLRSFAYRGWAYHRRGQSEEAIKDYSEAIKLAPEASYLRNNRGAIYSANKKYDLAIEDYNEAIRINNQDAYAYRNRAVAHTRLKQFDKAVDDYTTSDQIQPNFPPTLNGMAWVLATCDDAKVRNGKRSLELASKACELTQNKNGGFLDTLAAAYAEIGDFDKAVQTQEQALTVGDIPIKDLEAAKKRLKLYKDKKPYRDDQND